MLLKLQVKKLGFQRQRFIELWHAEEVEHFIGQL